MKQFILDSPDADGIVRLQGKDYHYLARVRRVRPGAVFTALLPDGKETELTVLSVSDGVLRAQCTAPHDPVSGNLSLPPIYLFQALPKGNKMDLIVRQAAEGGIFQVCPFVSEFSQVKTTQHGETSGPPLMAEKIRRWERIIREARQQSNSPVPTTVKAPSSAKQLLDYWQGLKKERQRGVGILLHQDPPGTPTGHSEGSPLAQLTFHDYLSDSPEFVVLAVGPEGGFSSGEAAEFQAAGFRPLQMGNTILRTETAALYGAAAIRIILLESAAWAPKIRQ